MACNLADFFPVIFLVRVKNREAVTGNNSVSGICSLLPVVRQVCLLLVCVCGISSLFYGRNTHIWRFESFGRLLLLLSRVHFSVCGAEGGGITAFDGSYFGSGVMGGNAKSHIKRSRVGFISQISHVKHGAFRKNPSTPAALFHAFRRSFHFT